MRSVHSVLLGALLMWASHSTLSPADDPFGLDLLNGSEWLFGIGFFLVAIGLLCFVGRIALGRAY